MYLANLSHKFFFVTVTSMHIRNSFPEHTRRRGGTSLRPTHFTAKHHWCAANMILSTPLFLALGKSWQRDKGEK